MKRNLHTRQIEVIVMNIKAVLYNNIQYKERELWKLKGILI